MRFGSPARRHSTLPPPRAPNAPPASSATRPRTAFGVRLRLPGGVEQTGDRVDEGQTHRDAVGRLASAAACAAVFTPKPTATGNVVCPLIRATAILTFVVSGDAVPVMPRIET